LLGTPTWPPCLCHFIPLGMSENQEYAPIGIEFEEKQLSTENDL
jgi:hypothetical protein